MILPFFLCKFYGIEAEAGFVLIPNNLDLGLFADYVRGKLKNNGNIPRMTPLRFGLEFNYNLGNKPTHHACDVSK